jgi:16S rRNA (cytosine967-C5)-methyltransferase
VAASNRNPRRARSGTPRGARGTGRRRPHFRDDPRRIALRTIRRVAETGAYSSLTLAAELDRSNLDERDRQLAAELAYGTLRRVVTLDPFIEAAATRPLRRIDPPALALLRVGAYQLYFTRVPPHAAVSATVALADQRHRGFVNAVLRKLSSRSLELPSGDRDEDLAVRTGLSRWAVGELRLVLPAEEVEPAAEGLATRADLALRVNRCRTSAEEVREALALAGHDPRPAAHRPDVLHVRAAIPSRLPGFREGWFAVQDEASVLVAASVEAEPGERILDACAAPGGKTAFLACEVQPGGVVVAADARPGRSRLVARTVGRMGVPALVLAQDARAPALRGGFDAVLVDAPCSGLGVARRRPELLWRPQPSDLARLARLQVAILTGASDLVRKGGRLLYSVCTFPRAETEAAVRAFLAKRPDFQPAEIPGPDGPASSHRLWPHRHGTDAMFLAGFRRSG